METEPSKTKTLSIILRPADQQRAESIIEHYALPSIAAAIRLALKKVAAGPF